MVRLLKSLVELGKALLARPKRTQEPNLHWVKADKPIGKMSVEERAKFSGELADAILEKAKKHKS